MSRKPAKNGGTATTTSGSGGGGGGGATNTTRVEPVEVFCRLRPLFDQSQEDTCIRIVDDTTLMLQVPAEGSRNGQLKQLVCSFSHVFDDSTTQKQIYSQVALPLVQDLLRGRNGLLFTYGVTGSGKTYSMVGNQQEAGMLQFSLDTIFSSIGASQMAPKFTFKPQEKSNWFEIQNSMDALADRHKEQQQRSSSSTSGRSNTLARQTQNEMNKLNSGSVQTQLVSVNRENLYGVFISCVEIYNNYIYDLLDESSATSANGAQDKESKTLREDQRTGGVYIKNVNECEVRSVEEALELMQKAQKKRVVAFTDLNAESSRSHSIFTIRVCQASQVAVQVNGGTAASLHSVPIQVSQLSLVDLAGSERTKRTNNTGSRLREAGGINSSLMALRNCMEVLRENCLSNSSTKKMVPYRDTKLTYLFKSYFDGYGKIRMVLCVNPSSAECDETINVLKFSELSRDVVVQVNEPRMPKSASINANMASCVKFSLDDLEKEGLVLLHQLQQNNYFSLMNENFPPMEITSPQDEQTLPNLVSYLEEFQRRKDAVVRELDLLKQKFYSKLRETSDETERLREERNEYKTRLDTRERDQIKSDSKIKALEKIINSNGSGTVHTSSSSRAQPMQSLPPPPPPPPPAPHSSTMTTSNNIGSSGGAGSHPTTNSGPFSSGSATSLNSDTPMLTTPYRSSRIQHLTNTILRQTGTQQQQQQSPVVAPQTPAGRAVGSIINTAAYNRYQTPGGGGFNAKPPPPPPTPQQQASGGGGVGVNMRDGAPVGNRRAQRRSKSVEMWLDHRPPTATKTDTVLQPKMPRKKSVSKLELNDAKKSTKYVLTHQSCDENGEIRTNLIKGDIIQSPSGGANVIFTDVETLEVRMQETPKPLKRTSEMLLEDPNVIEDRCAMGIEGHATRKIVKKTRM